MFRSTLDTPRLAACLLLLASLAGPVLTHAAEPLPLAIQGYDPVAYFTMSNSVPGLAELEYEWDEQRYWFAKPEHLARFKASPGTYAPRFGNLCAMALAEGQIKPADPRYWLISNGQLYLFGAPEGPQRFLNDLAGALSRAERNAPRER